MNSNRIIQIGWINSSTDVKQLLWISNRPLDEQTERFLKSIFSAATIYEILVQSGRISRLSILNIFRDPVPEGTLRLVDASPEVLVQMALEHRTFAYIGHTDDGERPVVYVSEHGSQGRFIPKEVSDVE